MLRNATYVLGMNHEAKKQVSRFKFMTGMEFHPWAEERREVIWA